MIEPVEHQLLIEVEGKEDEITTTGIIVKTKEQDEICETGKVIAAGGKVKKGVKGKRIAFKLYNADEININGVKCVFLEDKHIVAFIK